MDKKTQDLAWACLPKEARDEIKRFYEEAEYDDKVIAEEVAEIFDRFFGHHNLTSDTEPKKVMVIPLQAFCSLCADADDYINEHITEDSSYEYYQGRSDALHELASYKCLPDKTPEEKAKEIVDTIKEDIENPIQLPETMLYPQPSVQVEPKFKVGDDVIFRGGSNKITAIERSQKGIRYALNFPNNEQKCIFKESDLEPYTEPISQNSAENCDSENLNSNSDNMEAKELNLCELLKGCKGIAIYSIIDGETNIVNVGDKWVDTVCYRYNSKGYVNDGKNTLLYPSRALYEKYPLDANSAWMEWKKSRKPKYEVRSIIEYWEVGKSSKWTAPYNIIVSTKEEAEQAAEAVRECLEKFHEKNSEG